MRTSSGAHVGSARSKSLMGCVCLWASLHCGAAGAASLESPGPATSRIVVPIEQTALPDGAIRYSIAMRVDGQSFQVMLDSGSTGLRLMPAAVDRLHLEPGRVVATYRFSSGVVLRGPLVKVEAAIGTAAPAAILAQAVNVVSCGDYWTPCPAHRAMPDRFRIGADSPGDFRSGGFLAILGVGLRPGGIPNPLALIGKGRWIIELPLPVDRHPGRLILDPGHDELAAYKMFPLKPVRIEAPTGPAAGWRDTIPGCLRRKGRRQAICRPMLLDTGGIGFSVISDRVHWPTHWRAGSSVVLAFGSPATGSEVGFEFRSGQTPLTTVFMAPPSVGLRRYPPPINCGVMPYYYFSVAYDAASGAIGLKVRPALR